MNDKINELFAALRDSQKAYGPNHLKAKGPKREKITTLTEIVHKQAAKRIG